MIIFEYYEKSASLSDELELNNIDGSDYDYVIFHECQIDINHVEHIHNVIGLFQSLFLRGCCHNVAKMVTTFYGKTGVLGIAYHS